MSISLSVHLCPSASLSTCVHQPLCPPVSISLAVHLCPSASLSTCVHQPRCPPVSISLSVHLCPSASLSTCVHQPLCPPVSISLCCSIFQPFLYCLGLNIVAVETLNICLPSESLCDLHVFRPIAHLSRSVWTSPVADDLCGLALLTVTCVFFQTHCTST